MSDVFTRIATSTVALKVKLAVMAAVAVALFGAGFALSSTIKHGEIAAIELAHANVVAAAHKAQADAESVARTAEQKYDAALSVAQSTFEKTRQNEKATADRTITDLLRDVKRLRVSIKNSAANGLPASTAAAGSGDGQAEATLSGSVAARLAGRYADYNALITQLELCQATVIEQHRLTQ